jgi:serine/threonine protein kinase
MTCSNECRLFSSARTCLLHVTMLACIAEGSSVSACKKLVMVLEYLENDLEKISRSVSDKAPKGIPKRIFKIGDVKTYMLQLLKGLSAMHQKGILHRDLKLANLLVSKAGVLKLADFGLSRLSAKAGEAAGLLTPQVCTLWYRPPELLLTGCARPAAHVTSGVWL